MPRFDFNALPEEILDSFHTATKQQAKFSSQDLTYLLEETLLPPLIDVVQTQAEIRARNLVTEEQQQQFIATKAQDYGVTAEQLLQVMNSAYLYFPYIDEFRINKDGDNYSCNIGGGIIWYYVEVLADTPGVRIMHQETAGGFGAGDQDQSYYFSGSFVPGDKFAVYTAIDNFSRSLKTITQSIQEFQLFGSVHQVDGRWLEFDLGREEGVKVDDGFYIGEQIMQEDSTITTRKVGFVRTTSVGAFNDETYSLSRASAITGRRFAKGMTVIEHPRMPLDFIMRIQSIPVNVNKGGLSVRWLNDTDILETHFDEAYTGDALGFDLEMRYHLGRHFDVPMLLFTVGGSVNPVPMDVRIRSFGRQDWVATSPSLLQGRVGIEKKYFWRRIGFTLGGHVGITSLNASETIWGFDLESHRVGLSNTSLGAGVQTGLELVLTPDFHVGVSAGFLAYPGSSSWSLDIDDDSYELLTMGIDDSPMFRNIGPQFGLYFHYQPPALSFNPLNIFQSLSGI